MRWQKSKEETNFDKSQPLTPRERELLALFRVMAEGDRRLLLSTAEKMISNQGASGSEPP